MAVGGLLGDVPILYGGKQPKISLEENFGLDVKGRVHLVHFSQGFKKFNGF